MLLAGWVFGGLLFFKIAIDALFYSDVSIIGALLLGIMVGISAFISAGLYAVKMGQHLARVNMGQRSNFFSATMLIWIIVIIINVLIGKLLVFGFAKSFNHSLGGDVFYDFGRFRIDESLTFVALIALPVTLHYVSVLFGVWAQEKEMTERLSDSETTNIEEKNTVSDQLKNSHPEGRNTVEIKDDEILIEELNEKINSFKNRIKK